MSFSDLGLLPELLRAVADKGYDTPSPIQIQAIPAVLAGRDVLAGAQTGTGKTAGFVLPILQRLAADRRNGTSRAPRALVLTPTRELAAQVAQSARDYGKYMPLRTYQVFGGVSINPQISALRSGCDILVATPGRLLDLAQQRAADLSKVQVLVLDEADRMLDMGFIHDIRRIIKLLPQKRQNLLFSATYSDDIRGLAERLLHDPAVDPGRAAQCAHRAGRTARLSRAEGTEAASAGASDPRRPVAPGADLHAHQARREPPDAAARGRRHSSRRHPRQQEPGRARQGARHVQARTGHALVATEVAARGLDIKELPQVVNYELPNVPEDYVHRIGRTGRAGAAGEAISLVSADESGLLRDIERVLRRSIPDASPTPAFKIVESAPRHAADGGHRGQATVRRVSASGDAAPAVAGRMARDSRRLRARRHAKLRPAAAQRRSR